MTNSSPTNTLPSNFIRAVIEKNIKMVALLKKNGMVSPGDKAHHNKGSIDKA